MSKSLAVQNGDLVLGAGRSFEVVAGKKKLAQDLALWVYEEAGLDPSAPGLGTTFEGGFVDGQYVMPTIGKFDSFTTKIEVRQQISELLRKYMVRQSNKIRQDMLLYNGRTTMDPGEVIKQVNDISITSPVPTQMRVKVTITTILGDTLNVLFPVAIVT